MRESASSSAGASHPDQGLGRDRRLRSSRLFAETYAQGRRWTGRYMVLWRRDAPDGALRLGTVSSRKVGQATRRNRARRLLREAWRRNRHAFSGMCDVVLVARHALPDAAFGAVEEELLELARRAGLWTP